MKDKGANTMKAERYIRQLRSTDKRQYAVKYLAYLKAETAVAPDRGGLSAMAAQSVRISLAMLQD
jgi:hypothetical protein